MYYTKVTETLNNHHGSQTDEELARLVQKGDVQMFGTLVDRYEVRLLRYGHKFLARREDVEDIVQDIFISAYQNLRSFDTSQRFSPWVYRIAHNAFVNALRRKSYSPLTLIDFDTLLSHRMYDDPASYEREQREMKVLIEKGLDQLDAKYREVIILYYLEEIPYKEIAEILEVPTGTIGIRLKRAKEALKKVYEKMHIEYEH